MFTIFLNPSTCVHTNGLKWQNFNLPHRKLNKTLKFEYVKNANYIRHNERLACT